jgi:hypothetical protein
MKKSTLQESDSLEINEKIRLQNGPPNSNGKGADPKA